MLHPRLRSLSPLALAGSLLVLALPGCGLLLDDSEDDEDASTLADAGAVDGAIALDADAPDAAADDAAALPDAAVDASAPLDAGPVECVAPLDCESLHGPPPCGAWECNAGACDVVCAGCADADRDGYGSGAGCAGGDCDDADDTVGPMARASCYAGPAGTEGVGACVAGERQCVDGRWSACLGSVTPAAESCNGVDDDCDGAVDDGMGTISCGLGACTTTLPLCSRGAIATCIAPVPLTSVDGCSGTDDDCDGRIDEDCTDCVWVSTTGSDATVDPRVRATPFRNVQTAIDWAAADASRPQRVCLLAQACSTSSVFSGPVTMAEGVAVQGNYAPGGLMRCAGTPRTEIQTRDATGVLFPSSIAAGTTELSDVTVTPFTGASTSAAITVDGAFGAVIRGVLVQSSSPVTNGYGIDVRAGADALITRSTIYAGRGTSEGIGVRVVGARAEIRDNCPSFDARGRCAMDCGFGGTAPGIRGRQDASGARAAVSYAVLLRDARGSIVGNDAICGAVGSRSSGVRIEGDASGVVVHGSRIAGWGGELEAWGVDVASCTDAAPWIVDNVEIFGEGGVTAPQGAVHAAGLCRPVIERNDRLLAGLEGRGVAYGVYCGVDGAGAASRCVIDGNPEIRASVGGFPMAATGVRCDGDACARITGNTITAYQGVDLIGLRLETTDAIVDRNYITGGCATGTAIGVLATGSRARLSNDLIRAGARCASGTGASARRYVALLVEGASTASWLDVRSCDLDPLSSGTTCESRGIEIRGAGPPAGVFRGDVVLAGTCGSSYPLLEVDAASDPIAIQSCDLVPATGRPVYRDEGTTDLTSAAAVDALGDTVASGNLDVAPGFVSYPGDLHLGAGSPLIDADLASGAPAVDLDGRPRTGVPDIGAYEH